MPSVQQLVETQLKVIDQASAVLRKIGNEAAGTTKALHTASVAGESLGSKLYNGLRDVAGIAGIAGGALSLKAAWDSTEKYVKSLKEVRELTGASAQETDYLFSAARRAGVEYKTMEQTMFGLSRKGAMLEQTMALSNGKHVPGMQKKFQRLGVSMDKGPVAAISAMSKAVKSGKLDASELMSTFRIPAGSVNDFKGFLETLDNSALAKMQNGKSKFSGLVQNSDVDNFDKMEQAQHRMADAWNRIKVMVMTKFIPVVADMADGFAKTLESVLPTVDRIAGAIRAHMDQIKFAAKAFVAVMTGRKMLEMLEKLSQSKLIAKLGAPVQGVMGKLGGGGQDAGLAGSVKQLMMAGPLLAVIAAAVWLLYQGWKAIDDNVAGLRVRFLFLFDTIRGRFDAIVERINDSFKRVMAIFGEQTSGIGETIGKGLLKILEYIDGLIAGTSALVTATNMWLAQAMDFGFDFLENWQNWVFSPLMKMVGDLADVIRKVRTGDVLHVMDSIQNMGVNLAQAALGMGMGINKITAKNKSFGVLFNEALVAQDSDARKRAVVYGDERKKAAGRDTPDARPPANNYDFRGSRFDITQQFAEGFDPDRIAVAFANDLSSLGEMRTQSGLANAFATR